jgi:hypothetical protein
MKEWIIKGLIATISIASPIAPLLIACGVLVMFDMITGMIAASKRKENIQSAEMRRSISKFVIYQIAILSGFALGTHIMGGFVPVAKIVASVIGMVELKSVLENVSVIAGQDIVKLVI